MKAINLRPIYEQIIPAVKFFEIYEKIKDNVLRTEIVPPQLGRPGDLGGIKVIFRDPVYAAYGDSL
ncbi:MAG: hypothetical protein J5706_06780 [Elusimicrobiales bacterium]|nr:hypothetical protein [Elusimicrobiales bacterium]